MIGICLKRLRTSKSSAATSFITTACVICRADVLAGESHERITYKMLLILHRPDDPQSQASFNGKQIIDIAKDAIKKQATVVEKEVLEIPNGKVMEEVARNLFISHVFEWHGGASLL